MTKVCEDCGEERTVPEEISAYVQARFCCYCKLRRGRERARASYARDGETRRAYNREWKKRNRDKQRQYEREFYHRKVATREGRVAYREGARMTRRLAREKDGRPMPPVSEEAYVKRYGNGYGRGPRVDAEPMRRLLKLWLDSREDIISEFGSDAGQAVLGMHTQSRLMREAGVSERSIARVLNGQKTMALRNADKICTALDVPLALVYPEAI